MRAIAIAPTVMTSPPSERKKLTSWKGSVSVASFTSSPMPAKHRLEPTKKA
ncbi:hypothetical protein D3C72_921920 [compost metagenome]